MAETLYTPTEYLPESHPHECFGQFCIKAGGKHGSAWLCEDPDCRYPMKYDCPLCDEAPTDWKLITEEPMVTRRIGG